MKNESQTLYIPLYGKALMSKEGFYKDKKAEEIVSSKPYDFSKVDTSRRLAVYMAMRAAQFDELTKDFVRENPNAIVIQLGCGLDSRCIRADVNAKLWYDIDFTEVIKIRERYYQSTDQYHMIASSATDFNWFNKITYSGEPVLVLAEGLSMYLTEQEITNLIIEMKRCFSKAVFIFDAYSSFALKMSKYKNPVNDVDAKVSFSLDNPDSLIKDIEGIRCILDSEIILKKYLKRLKGIYKMRFMFMRRFGSGLYRIYGYEM